MKIAFSGTHGTGKTMDALDCSQKYKKWYPDSEIEIITEVARKTPFRSLNRNTTIESQLWMFNTQMIKELEASLYSNIVICDRSIVDYIAYTSHVSEDVAKNMKKLVWNWISSYDKIYFKTVENNDFLISDGVRDEEDEFREEIETRLLNYYYEFLGKGYNFEFVLI